MKQYYIGLTMLAATLAATSCSDFDDYNEVPAEASVEATQSLWEAINSREDLTEFAALVKKSGYDKELSSSRFYTVWAPINGKIDSKWATLDSATLRFQFIENHIADYNHYISAPVNDRIRTVNEKSYTFAGTRDMATFGDISIFKSNIAGVNGVMHLLDGEAVYRPNLYEYLKSEEDNNTLAAYVMGYENEILDEKNSVLGPIIDGIQTYEDSVMVITNAYTDRINALLSDEDSTYTMIIPTNEAWDEAYSKIKSTVNYGNGTIKSTCHYMDNVTHRTVEVTAGVDAAYLSDSLAKRYLTDHLVFSNTNNYNKWLISGAGPALNDTLYSTRKNKFSAPWNVLESQQGEPIKMSNGEGRIVSELNYSPWEWYKPVLGTVNYAAYQNFSVPRNVTVRSLREDLSNTVQFPGTYYGMEYSNLYFTLFDGTLTSDRNVFFNLIGARSAGYRVYCIVVPPDADLDHASYEPEPEMKQSLFNASLSYYNPTTGKISDHYFLRTSPDGTTKKPSASSATRVGETEGDYAFYNELDRIDAVYLGDFTFPASYYNIQSGDLSKDQICCPTLTITAPRQSKDAKENYTRALRIAGIVLIPTELSNSNETK